MPTFNRAEYLRISLASVLASRVECKAKAQVEIVISDNAGTDNTAEVVNTFLDAGADIRYFRQQNNIGAPRNIRLAAELGGGQFVWIFGDDDKMEIEAVSTVMTKIAEGADAVICNVAISSRDFIITKSRFLPIYDDISFSNPNHVMGRLGPTLGYISGAILNREAFMRVPFSEYISFDEDGTCFLYAAYSVLRICRKIEFIAAPLVINWGEASDADLLSDHHRSAAGAIPLKRAEILWNRVFAQGFPRTLDFLAAQGYHRSAIRKGKTLLLFFYLFPRLLLLKNRRHGSWTLMTMSAKYFYELLSFWLLFVPCALLPLFILRYLKRGKDKLTKKFYKS